MRNRVWIAAGIAVLVVVMGAAGAEAKRPKKSVRAPAERARTAQPFSVSGEFSGVLAGEILVGDTSYRLASDVQIYEIDTGPIPVGTAVEDRLVYLAGEVNGQSTTIHAVIVRPAGELAPDSEDPSRYVREKDPASDEPR